jgi:hypothetical protein
VIDYDDMQDGDGASGADGRRDLPVAAVIAVEDHEGRVLYSDVHFTTHPVGGDMRGDREEARLDPRRDVAAIIAAYACSLGHLSYRRSCR